MKKRNLLLLVCVIIALALVMVSCGNKNNEEVPHQHTFDTNNWTSDATGHWHAATCDDAATAKLQFAAHSDSDKNGVCDVCEYVTCAHEYDTSAWVSDETNHWHAASCGCNVTSDLAAHADENKDGKCDTCEYTTCEHSFADEYTYDENGHWLAYTCGCELEPEVLSHEDKNKDGNCDACAYVLCAHNPESSWSSDVHSHWHASDCDCLVKIDEAAHVYEGDVYVCTVCGYECLHELESTYSADASGHWKNTVCGHDSDAAIENHVDENMDGKCDVCAYEDPTHVHSWATGSNKHQHYSYTDCEHILVKDFVNHADEDADGNCDECGVFMTDIADILGDITSSEAASKVTGGAIYTDRFEQEKYTEYSIYKDYITYELWGDTYYLSTYNVGGVPTLFKVSVSGYDSSVYYDSSAIDVEEMKGPYIGLMYYYINAYGVEDYIWNLYDYATNGEQTIYNYVDYYNEEIGMLSFSFARLESTEFGDGDFVQFYSVSLTIENGVVIDAYVNASEYFEGDYFIDEENGVFIPHTDAEPTMTAYFAIHQTVGEREDGNNPYKASDFLILDFKIYNQATGEEIKNGDIIETLPGSDNAVYIVLSDEDAAKVEFNPISVTGDGMSSYKVFGNTINYPYKVYGGNNTTGDYNITYTCGDQSVTFTLRINKKAPSSLTGAVVVDGEKTEASSVSTFVGVNVTLGAIAASSSESTATTAAVTTGDPDVISITADGENWVIKAAEAGTYTITLTAKGNSVSTNITLVVEDAPSPVDQLNGTYVFVGMGENVKVVFTPEYEGALNGTVKIDFDNGAMYNRVQFVETASYVYENGVITLTHVDGDGLEKVGELKINADYNIELVILPYGSQMASYTVSYVLVEGEDEPVVAEPDGTFDAPYVLTESTEISANVPEWAYVYYTFVAPSNGTITLTVKDGFTDFDIAYGKFNFFMCDMMFESTATIEIAEGETLYLLIGTMSGDALTYGVSLNFEAAAPEALTLESLAGTWEGTESNSFVSAGKTWAVTLNLNADGTGTGNHAELGDFNVTGITIDGDNVTIVTDISGTNNKTLYLTYANGTLTLIEGQKAFYFGTSFSLNHTSGGNVGGGDEGGDDIGGDIGGGDDTGALTLASLAGTWEGTESDSFVSAGKTWIVTLNLNADGTGTGSHSELGNFNVTGITIDGNNVTIVTDVYGTNNKTLYLVYVDGALNLIDGQMAMYFGKALSFTKTTAGGDEGGADVTLDDIAGYWEGEEVGFGSNSYQITINADGTGYGTYITGFGPGAYPTDFEFTVSIENGVIIMVVPGYDNMEFTYENETLVSEFALNWGTLTLNKAEKPEGGDEGEDVVIPEMPNLEYLAGTWYGSESDSSWYPGEHTFVIEITADGLGVVTHSYLGTLNITYIDIYYDIVSIYTDSEENSMVTLLYVYGDLCLYEGAKNFTYGSSLYMSKTAPEGGDEPNPPAHEHNFVNGMCECGESDPNYQPPSTEEAPADLTEEYLVGTWTGTESGSTWYPGDYTITITFNADGSATMTHSYADIEIYDFYVEGNIVTILSSAEMSSVMLEYSNGTFSLLEGSKNFTFGNVLTLTKGAADNGGDEGADEPAAAPADLTEEYLVGTWTGTESGSAWYPGEFTFTITFNADHTATMTHSEYGDVEIYDYYTEGNVLTIMCSAEMSTVMIEYSNGTFHVLDGAKNFTYGSELTMTKA